MTLLTETVREVRTDALLLRGFSDDDADMIAQAFVDPETARWNAGLGADREAVLEWLHRRNDWTDGAHLSWAVTETDGSRLGFRHLGLHRVRLHHAVDNVASCAEATRTGYLLEAC